MVAVIWTVAMVAMGVALAVLARGVPRVLGLVALAVLLLNFGVSVFVIPMMFESDVSVTLVRVASGVLGILTQIVVLGLFIAAAAIASRARPVAQPNGVR